MYVKILAAIVLVSAISGSNAQAAVLINFEELPNEGGIHLGGLDTNGNVIDVTKLNSETFHISSPAVPSGYSPDAILSRIGISQSSPGFLVNILESVGGIISDQVYVHRLNSVFTVIDFISDPDQFVTGVQPFSTVVETGVLQNVLNYTNDRGEIVTINVQSDVETVPESSSLTPVGLVAFGGLVAGAIRRRRQTKADF